MAYFEAIMPIYPAQNFQITLLMAEKVNILVKYLDFTNIFLKKLAGKLFKYFDINEYLINLEPEKQPPYSPIFSLKAVKLKTVKV